jgi:hypothetical protein
MVNKKNRETLLGARKGKEKKTEAILGAQEW